MKYVIASKKQRIFSFLIDGILVGGLGFLLGWLVVHFSGLDDYYMSVYSVYYENVANGTAAGSDVLYPLAIKVAEDGVYIGFYLIISLGYLIVLPLFVSWQTLGRLITKTRLLICKKDIKPDFKHLVLREIVGEFLLYMVLTVFLKAWNIIFWLSALYALMSGASFPDRISHLKLVNKDPEEEIPMDEDFEYPEDYDFEADNGILDEKTFSKKEVQNLEDEDSTDNVKEGAEKPR